MNESHRTFEEVLSDAAPKESAPEYSKAWEAFKDFAKFSGQPSKEAMASTLIIWEQKKDRSQSLSGQYIPSWMIHTNNTLDWDYNNGHVWLRSWKSYSANYERKVAKTFSREEILQFLVKSHDTHPSFWLLRKAYMAIDFCGGLRTAEMKSLQIQDCYEYPNGDFKITYHPPKQKSVISKTFIVPKNETSPAHCKASYVKAYLSEIKKKFETGPLFQTCMKGATAKFSDGKACPCCNWQRCCKRPWPTGPRVIH